MNSLDFASVIFLTILVIWGAWQGLIKSLFYLFSWIAGALAMGFVAASFATGPLWLPIVAGIAAFFTGLLLLRLIGSILNTVVDAIPIVGSFNRMGGALLGLFKALLFIYALFWILQHITLPSIQELCKESQLFAIWQDFRIHTGKLP